MTLNEDRGALLRTERAIEGAVAAGTGRSCPPKLAAAIRHAVFPAGGRVRPSLCFAVAAACAEVVPPLADAAAASVELLHCASLVHDDLPCFDDAATRRGRPSVHRAFGEEMAVLVGDALIVMAFRNVAMASGAADRVVRVLQELSRGSGPEEGIIAGQAWESEERIDTPAYQHLKTGTLFEAALVAGALAVGADGEPWRAAGGRLGEAYQVADDLADLTDGAGGNGKPAGRDAALGRPNTAADLGVGGALERLASLIDAACQAVPPCAGAPGLRAALRKGAERLVPAELRRLRGLDVSSRKT